MNTIKDELEDGLGLCEERAQALGVAAGEHVGVGVRRKDRDVDREARPGGDGAAPRSADGALHLLGEIDPPALGGVLPGGVAVEGDDRPLDPHRVEHVVLVFGQCGTHGGDRVREAGLVERDRVEVPLDDHRDALLPDGGAGGVQGVEDRALVEECCSL